MSQLLFAGRLLAAITTQVRAKNDRHETVKPQESPAAVSACCVFRRDQLACSIQQSQQKCLETGHQMHGTIPQLCMVAVYIDKNPLVFFCLASNIVYDKVYNRCYVPIGNLVDKYDKHCMHVMPAGIIFLLQGGLHFAEETKIF